LWLNFTPILVPHDNVINTKNKPFSMLVPQWKNLVKENYLQFGGTNMNRNIINSLKDILA